MKQYIINNASEEILKYGKKKKITNELKKLILNSDHSQFVEKINELNLVDLIVKIRGNNHYMGSLGKEKVEIQAALNKF